MRISIASASLGVMLAVLVAAPVAAAGSSAQRGSAIAELERTATAWITYAVNGNAPKACHLQVEPSVGGTPCRMLPTYFEPRYCPANPRRSPSPWREPDELVAKPRVKGGTGTVGYRASLRRSRAAAKATFTRVGGRWRIASIRSGGQRLVPAGLIFTVGAELRHRLWPPHCPGAPVR